jgi:hypothetical protein
MNKSPHEFFTQQLREKFNLLPKDQKDLIRNAHNEGLDWRGEDTQTKHAHLGGMSHFEYLYHERKKLKHIGLNTYRITANLAVDKTIAKLVKK